MALEELRGAKQLTQSDMAEMPLSTKPVKASGLTKAMRALHLPEVQIASLKAWLEKGAGRTEIAGGGPGIDRVFSVQDLVAAGFDETNTDQT